MPDKKTKGKNVTARMTLTKSVQEFFKQEASKKELELPLYLRVLLTGLKEQMENDSKK